jgi:hypothetical protein
MKGRILLAAVASGLAAVPAGSGFAASDNASCVGTYSSYFAHLGMRDEQAHRFSHGNQIYSFVAQYHGDLASCNAQVG